MKKNNKKILKTKKAIRSGQKKPKVYEFKVSLMGTSPLVWRPDSPEKDELLAWLGGYYNPTTFDPNFINRFFLWNEY